MDPTKKPAKLSNTKALEDTPYKMPKSGFERKMVDMLPESNPVECVTHNSLAEAVVHLAKK